MSQTFKVLGSGPMSGFVAYGHIQYMDILSDDGVVLCLDQEYSSGNRTFSTLRFSAVTGTWLIGSDQCDLFHIDPNDLAKLRMAWAEHHNGLVQGYEYLQPIW